jgi:hypothetical protein
LENVASSSKTARRVFAHEAGLTFSWILNEVLAGSRGRKREWGVNFNFPPRNNATLESTGAGKWEG